MKADVKVYHMILAFLSKITPCKLWGRVGVYLFAAQLFYSRRLRRLLFPDQGSGERLFEYSWVLENLRGGGDCLDVGCGDSLFGHALVRRGLKVYAVDLNRQPTTEKNQKIHFAQADITKAPFKSNSFDWIVAVSTIEHIEDKVTVMKELSRLLREDGTLLVTVPLGDIFFNTSTLGRLQVGELRLLKEDYYQSERGRWLRTSKEEAVKKVGRTGEVTGLALLAFRKTSKMSKDVADAQ